MPEERKRHVFVETVQSMADGNWGREYDSKKEAIQSLCGNMGVADAALLEMLRRFGLVVKALVNDAEEPKKDIQRPENAKTFAEAKVGDILYGYWELTEGIDRYIVVALAEDDYVRVVGADQSKYTHERVTWGWDGLYATEAEAAKALATTDYQYYAPRAQLARALLKAVEAGDDLAFVRDGVQLPKESDAVV